MITGYAGDAVMTLFPLENGPEQAVIRAVAAAWEIQKHMAENPEHNTEYGTFSISAKIGIAGGNVAWGILTSEDETKATYFFHGMAVVGAAVIEQQAQAGEILLAEDIFQQVQDKIEGQPVQRFFRLTGIKGRLPVPRPVPD